MFVNFLKQIYVIIQRRIQGGGAMGAHPPPGSVKYMLFEEVLPHPTKKKKKCISWGLKPEYASLNIFKAMSSSQLLLNLSKYKSEDQEVYFEDLHFSD